MIAWNLVRFYGTKHATDVWTTINEDFLVNNSEKCKAQFNVRFSIFYREKYQVEGFNQG